MRIQDIRRRRQELQTQLFHVLDRRCSLGANIVRELSSLADEEDQLLEHSLLRSLSPIQKANMHHH